MRHGDGNESFCFVAELKAEELKDLGNKAFATGKFQEAIEHFTEAISLDSKNHVLFSNRSAAYASLGKYHEARTDAEKTVSLKGDWAKVVSLSPSQQ